MNCTISVVKTKALISFAVTVKLICVFAFAYAKTRFSHKAQISAFIGLDYGLFHVCRFIICNEKQ